MQTFYVPIKKNKNYKKAKIRKFPIILHSCGHYPISLLCFQVNFLSFYNFFFLKRRIFFFFYNFSTPYLIFSTLRTLPGLLLSLHWDYSFTNDLQVVTDSAPFGYAILTWTLGITVSPSLSSTSLSAYLFLVSFPVFHSSVSLNMKVYFWVYLFLCVTSPSYVALNTIFVPRTPKSINSIITCPRNSRSTYSYLLSFMPTGICNMQT